MKFLSLYAVLLFAEQHIPLPSAVGSRNERLNCYRFIGKVVSKLDWYNSVCQDRGEKK